MYEQLDVRPLLAPIRIPTPVLYRTGDQLIPPEMSRALAAGIPDAKELELPGEDHLVFAGDQDSLLVAIEELEVLTSSTVRDLVVGSGLGFEDRGRHTLKGVPGEWALYAAAGDTG